MFVKVIILPFLLLGKLFCHSEMQWFFPQLCSSSENLVTHCKYNYQGNRISYGVFKPGALQFPRGLYSVLVV